MASSVVALCGRCRRDTLPQLNEPSWHRDVHRAAAREMITEPDPRAERIKARKERKGRNSPSLRAQTRTEGFAAVAKAFLVTKQADAPVEDCPDCAAIQNARNGTNATRAQFLGYDPKSHSAFVREIL